MLYDLLYYLRSDRESVRKPVFLSVVIPTYNRLPILQKCLAALGNQALRSAPVTGYEVIVVDDGSTDATVTWLKQVQLAYVRWFEQDHQGPAAARNLGVEQAQGDVIIFIDSDLVVTERFLQAHAEALVAGEQALGHNRLFTYGSVINTCNFETGNVAIGRQWLEQAGLFDTGFQLYGWEDLELGVRLKQLGLKLIKCPEAKGYHWHPPFALNQLPQLIDKEIQRGRMGVLFYQKHPTWQVRMMIQMTWIHRLLWGVLSLGGWLNERTMAPFLQWLIDQNRPQLALEAARIFLNWYNVKGVYAAYGDLQRLSKQ
jgi:glycosyltransferase involved in cell wall biosynthesis